MFSSELQVSLEAASSDARGGTGNRKIVSLEFRVAVLPRARTETLPQGSMRASGSQSNQGPAVVLNPQKPGWSNTVMSGRMGVAATGAGLQRSQENGK